MAAIDDHSNFSNSLESPASGAFSITPHNTNELASVTRGVYVGGAGNLSVIMRDGQQVTFVGLSAGSILPIRARLVKSTGTTATNLVGLT